MFLGVKNWYPPFIIVIFNVKGVTFTPLASCYDSIYYNLIDILKNGKNLSFDESKTLFNELMEGKYDEITIIEILESLLKIGETKDELAGGIFFLREK